MSVYECKNCGKIFDIDAYEIYDDEYNSEIVTYCVNCIDYEVID